MGSTDVRDAVVEEIAGHWNCDHISVADDHRSMADPADERWRPDWAHALRTGRVMDRPGEKV